MKTKISPLFENAIDSLEVGMKFFMDQATVSANKHAILTIFHSIELLLKEALYRVNPILIYRKIDQKITDDSITVGLPEIFSRFDNLNIRLSSEEKTDLIDLKKKRNRIEHHKYNTEKNDNYVIGKSLKFIIGFLIGHLDCDLKEYIEEDLYNNVLKLVLEYKELKSLADTELDSWIEREYPNDKSIPYGEPGSFPGTMYCPYCNEEFLVMDSPKGNYCFFCRTNVDVLECIECGMAFKKKGNTQSSCPECLKFYSSEKNGTSEGQPPTTDKVEMNKFIS